METVLERCMAASRWLLAKLANAYIGNFGALLLGFSIAFAILLLCLVVECIFLGWRDSSLRRLTRNPSRDATIDGVSFLLVQWSLDPLLYAAMSFGLIPLLRAGLPRLVAWRADLTFLPTPIELIAYLLLVDFLAYWSHRLHHEIPFLWRLHSFHHSATEFNMLTAVRDHPMERGFNQLFIYLPLAFVDVEKHLPLWLGGALTAYGLFKHSMVPWNWGWLGKYVLQSPIYHRIHHSYLPEHHDKNYGNILGIWDHLFGTFYFGDRINIRVGVTGDSGANSTYFRRLWLHFRDFLQDIRDRNFRYPVAQTEDPHVRTQHRDAA